MSDDLRDLSPCSTHLLSGTESQDCFSMQGYQGMVDGGCHIIPAGWRDASNLIQKV